MLKRQKVKKTDWSPRRVVYRVRSWMKIYPNMEDTEEFKEYAVRKMRR